MQYQVGINQSYQTFDRFYDDQHSTGLSGSLIHPRATVTGSLTIANRFNQDGHQVGLSAYPVINDTFYAYLGYDYSPDVIFPEHSIGAELFASLPKKFEASLGLRYLTFASNASSLVLTGSVSHYRGPWLFMVRPFFIFSDSGNGQALSANARYYYSNTEYFFARGSFGVTADSRFLLSDNGTFDERQLLLKSQSGGIGVSHLLTESLTGTASVDISRRELGFNTGTYVTQFAFQVGLSYLF